jgi:hypothetical protein
MGARRDRGLAVTRYLTGRTGIPGLSWEGEHSEILSPFQYQIDLTTSRKLQVWHDLIRQELNKTHIVIRYDASMDSIDQAWVGMLMYDFVPLLTNHYETNRKGEE